MSKKYDDKKKRGEKLLTKKSANIEKFAKSATAKSRTFKERTECICDFGNRTDRDLEASIHLERCEKYTIAW